MKTFIREIKNKSLLAYILSFSAIIVFIVISMGSYLYWFFQQTVYQDYENANQEYLVSIQSQHENNMKILDDIMMQLSLAGSDVEFILKKQPQKNLKLKNTLYQYFSVSQFFERIFFFYHEDQYLYTHSTSNSVEQFIHESMKLEHLSPEQLRRFLYSNKSGLHVISEQLMEGYWLKKSGAVVSRGTIYALPLEPRRTSTVFFQVSADYYDQLLGSREADLRSTFIFNHDQLVVSRGNIPAEAKLLELMQGNSERFQQKARLNGENFLLTGEKGKSGLYYCTVQSEQIFRDKIAAGRWGILLLLAVCSIPTSLVFLYLSRSLSGKVRKINALLGADETYNLDFLESGVRILAKNHNQRSEESVTFHRTRFVSDFVRDRFGDKGDMLASASAARLDVDKEWFVVALMGDGGDSEENATEMLLRALADRRGLDGYGIHLISKNQSLYVIFADTTRELEELLEDFFVIGKNCCEEFIMAVSGFHQNFDQGDTAYLEADTAFSTRLLVDNSQIIYFHKTNLAEQLTILPDTYLQRLKNAIRRKKESEARKIIQEICEKLRSSRQSLLGFRLFCNDIIHLLIKEGAANEADFSDIYNVFSLSQCLTINDFHDILWEVSSRLMNASGEAVENKTDFVASAIDYMKQNYQDAEFNMSALAQLLGVSSVTLALKFKNEMEISPSEYLAILRMEQAKKLLLETSLQVKEVSQAVGYADARVFMRRFKKYTGKTPMQYRESE